VLPIAPVTKEKNSPPALTARASHRWAGPAGHVGTSHSIKRRQWRRPKTMPELPRFPRQWCGPPLPGTGRWARCSSYRTWTKAPSATSDRSSVSEPPRPPQSPTFSAEYGSQSKCDNAPTKTRFTSPSFLRAYLGEYVGCLRAVKLSLVQSELLKVSLVHLSYLYLQTLLSLNSLMDEPSTNRSSIRRFSKIQSLSALSHYCTTYCKLTINVQLIGIKLYMGVSYVV
jgi:hypothetical protein